MKVFVLAVAASILLVGSPLAQAFEKVQSSNVPAANGARIADPEDLMDTMDQGSTNNSSTTTPSGNSLRFGTTTNGANSNATGPFLQNPASRTVPSQSR